MSNQSLISAPFIEEIVRRHASRQSLSVRSFAGREFQISPTVFDPFISPSGSLSRIFPSLGELFEGKKMLDVGCGCGLTAISAAEAGAMSVLGLDINPDAIKDCKQNAQDPKSAERCQWLPADIRTWANDGQAFDVIFADLPLCDGPATSLVEQAFYDPGLEATRALLRRLGTLLSNGGVAYVCRSSFSELSGAEIGNLSNLHADIVASATNLLPNAPATLELVRLRRYT